jgi:Putative phage tail protein
MGSTIDVLKELQTPTTPLFLIDCVLSSGATEHWGTHAATISSTAYAARLLKHTLFQLNASSSDGLDGATQIALTLANADSHFSEIERETGFKGAQITIRFLFYDFVTNLPASEARVVFRGIANSPDEITESALRVTVMNRLNLQRIILPDTRIERTCPWFFPSTSAQRLEALTGGAKGQYSALYKCGYSPDQTGGVGNLNGSVPFTSCDYTRTSCVERGMFSTDAASHPTARFGGNEFVPAQILVRGYGQSGTQLSALYDNLALYNDFVPLVYGTAWYMPPIVFSRNDGNLTRMEVLLGMGPISGVLQVLVNDIAIPLAQNGTNMTATGWYSLVSPGTRSGGFDLNFTDSAGNPLGDPFGSMAYLSVVVPNAISSGQSTPTVQVLLNGLLIEQFDSTGASLGASFTNNPAWVLLDVLRRSGWLTTDVNLASFAAAATYCSAPVSTTDLYGNATATSRFKCNLLIQNRQSAAELAKSIRNASSLMLSYDTSGLLNLRVENTLALQQPTPPDGTNSTSALNGGWPSYEFSDGSATYSGILRNSNGDPGIRLYSQNGTSTTNQLTVEFQDEFNQFQQDSLTLVDIDDSLLTDRIVTARFAGVGLPNFDQATRMLQLQLNKAIAGYTLVEFSTSVKGIGIAPGDLITITYLKEGLERQPFRVVKIAPGQDYQTVQITAQWHEDDWYTTGGANASGGGVYSTSQGALPRPLVGGVVDTHGIEQFGITETAIQSGDGSFTIQLSVAFTAPALPAASSAAIPLLGLSPTIATTGGTIAGGQSLYYAISAVDSTGADSGLSFIVQATIPPTTNTNEVQLTGLSFSAGTAGFHVYRGLNPSQLLLIATSSSVATGYTDSGATTLLQGPPDENYNHANVYWRLELQPEEGVTTSSATTIGNSTLGMLANDFTGGVVRVTRGKGATQERSVVSNTTTTLTVTPRWTVIPDTTSFFTVADSTWNFGGLGATSPVNIDVPNRPGASVEVSGRSANVQDEESSEALNPLTSWQIVGEGGGGVDSGLPPAPVFGIDLVGQGTVDLVGIGFSGFTNTHTISAGTLILYYWNELNSPSTITLAAGIVATDTTITLSAAGSGSVGDRLQIETEIMQIITVLSAGLQYHVTRGADGTTAATHSSGVAIYALQANVSIVPFVHGFFGSPASGDYSYSVFLPDVRIASAGLFMTNVYGSGAATLAPFVATVDQGLRTLSGGQLSLQVEGYLATQTDAVPPLVIETTEASRDIFAVVGQAPSGGPVQLQLRQGSTIYCSLTIADGTTTSASVNGFGLPPLVAGSLISLDVLSVPGAADTLPGRDLTVIIRL